MKTGIYMIVIKDVYAYVGQSVNIDERLKKHKADIENKCHPNIPNHFNLTDCKFIELAQCSKFELNSLELEMYHKYCTSYIMLNKKTCGIQGVCGEHLRFYNDKNPSFEFVENEFIIDGIKIRRLDNMYCLTDLMLYIRNNSIFDFRLNSILIKQDFIDRINALYNIQIPKTRNTVKYLKTHGLYKVTGARSNKKIYCDFNLFVTIAFYSCPQFAASICIMIGNSISKTK